MVYLTAYVDEEILQRSKITGPYGYIVKPCQEKELYSAVEMALYKSEAEKALQASEERYRVLFESSPFLLAQYDKDGRFLLPNPAMAKGVGLPIEKLAGRKISELFPEEVAQPRMKHIRKALDEWQPQVFEDEARGRHFHNIFVPIRIPGKEDTIQVIAQDITWQKKARIRMEELRALESSIMSSIPHAVVGLEERHITFANDAVETVFGWKPGELIGKTTRVLYRSERDFDKIGRHFYPVLEKQQTYTEEFPCRRKDGADIMCLLSASRIGEELVRRKIVVTYTDFTEQKKAQQEINYQKKYFQSLFEGSPEAVASLDTQNRVININPTFEELFGYTLEDIKGKNLTDCIVPGSKKEEGKDLVRRAASETVFIAESVRTRADGKEVAVSILGAPIILDGKQIGTFAIFRDITKEKKGKERLRESEERYRVLFENSPLNLTQHDREGRFLLPNPAMAKAVGIPIEELAGRKMTELFPEEVVQRRLEYIRKTLDEWQTQVFEDQREGRHLRVTYAPIRIPGKEDTVQVIAQDITKAKKAEEELEQAFVILAETVSRAVATRDPYTVEHQQRVAELARLVGEKMGLEKHRLQGLYIGGLLHDIGKVSTPEGILTKPGKLSNEEWALIRAHPRQGYEILNGATFPWPITEMTLHHHERLDGSGYPDGISGDELSLEIRILGVCDVVEAMSSDRPYRPTRSGEEVLEELRNGRGTKYDAGVVDIILQIIESGEFKLEKEGQ